ncbi:MAG: RNA polymerase sigma factor [bacterium]
MKEDNKKEKFLDLLEPLLDKLYMYARMLEKNPQDAEDLVADTILTCYESFAQIKDENRFKAYLFKVTRNKFRRKNRRTWLFGSYDEEKALRMPSTESQQDLSFDVEILYNAIEKLPTKQKEAIVLFEISGFSIKEIKDIQGATLSAVKSRIKRGREKLTEMLNPKTVTNEIQHNNKETNKTLLKV